MEKFRKKPEQKRSQTLFESIIESAARVLPALGYARATTNRIAKRAGISIGSLYQYFPNKDAIIASLLERELNKHFDEVASIVEREEDRSLDEIVDLLVEKFYALYLGQKELSRELFINASKLNQTNEILFVRNRVVDVLSQLLVKKDKLDPELAKIKAFISLNAFMGIIQTCSLVKDLPMPEIEIKKQISSLIKAYLNMKAI